MDIMDSNSSIFVQAKIEYSKQLINTLKPHMYEMEKLEATDIDDMEDFVLAEALMKIRNEKI